MYYITRTRKYTHTYTQIHGSDPDKLNLHLWPPLPRSAALIHLLRAFLSLQNLPKAASSRQSLKQDQPATKLLPSFPPVGKFLSHPPHIITHRNAG